MTDTPQMDRLKSRMGGGKGHRMNPWRHKGVGDEAVAALANEHLDRVAAEAANNPAVPQAIKTP